MCTEMTFMLPPSFSHLCFSTLALCFVLVLLPVKCVHRDAGSSVSVAFVHILGAFCLCVGNRKANSVNSNLMSSLKTCLWQKTDSIRLQPAGYWKLKLLEESCLIILSGSTGLQADFVCGYFYLFLYFAGVLFEATYKYSLCWHGLACQSWIQ